MDAAAGDLPGPLAILRNLGQAVPKYLDKVDRGDLVYPACKRTPADVDGNARAIWEHTRIEAMRYIMLVPGRKDELLSILPASLKCSTRSCENRRTTTPWSISRALRSTIS
jgi:hypothetical protein